MAEHQPISPSSGPESPLGGKSPGFVDSAVSRALSRRLTCPLGLIAKPLNLLSASQNPFTMANGLDDESILEPFPYERVQSNISELVTASPPTLEGIIDLTRFGGHRDTFAILGLRRRQHEKVDLPLDFFEHLLPFIDFPTYLSIRLSCRSWSSAISQVRPLITPAAYRLPTEILQQIYSHLAPIDFDSARHTCRSWMMASLDSKLSKRMLKHGGWLGAAAADEAMIERSPRMAITNEWPLSKRLATECQLVSTWTGSGLPRRGISVDGWQQLSASNNYPALALAVEVDFSQLTQSSDALINFTPSVCGQYVLVVDDCTIHVFSLAGQMRRFHVDGAKAVEVITSLVCHQTVLAVSMDTSYGRFAVAALLKDRTGLVCELQNIRPRQIESPSQMPLTSRRNSLRWDLESSGDEMEIDEPRPNSSLAFYNRKGEMCPWAKGETISDTPERYDVTPPETSIPVEKGPRSIYRNVCSAEDPPRSIAICPQRQCVAFGCSGGIELHWTDPLTGENRDRWFPLANSSDYLYFIPPRAGIDSVKRLRLASSVAHPSEQLGLLSRYAPQMLESRQDEMVWECTSNMAFDRSEEARTDDKPDHYRAIPLSDGYHILFTDPATNQVCLGCERPDREAHESKFVKRVVLRTLREEGSNTTALPTCYAAAAELSWGVRVVVGYENGSLWFFSIPRDTFLASRSEGKDCQLDWLDEYDTYEDKNGVTQANEDASTMIAWPFQIRGVEVAHVKDLEEVCIDASNGTIEVWAFSTDGFARRWNMSNGLIRPIRKSVVLRDGSMIGAEDDDGDWIMRNAPWVPSYTATPPGYDGTNSQTSFQTALSLTRRANHRNSDSQALSVDSAYASAPDESSLSDREMMDVDESIAPSISERAFTPMELDIATPPAPLLASTSLDVDITAASTLAPTDINTGASPPQEGMWPTTWEPSPEENDFEDEGYASEDPTDKWARGPFAVRIPSVQKRWSGESFQDHDWTPDYLGTQQARERGSEDDLDLWEWADVELEIL